MSNLEMKVDTLIRMTLTNDESERTDLRTALRKMLAEKNTANTVEAVLLDIGVPDSIIGYRYLKYAIELAIDQPEMVDSITKGLYVEVAKKFDTTASRTERAIRHAIETAWERADYDALILYFGHTIDPTKGKPTNSHFIARIANALR